ncbi:ParB family chromosome partitioning protein [Crossiella equi]|uniref:ParB family chromosome partitioning protein n=1 Tax=Crossiella equi TaxID=130796 RepID=A0ABS5AMM3_9PSEU|nr:ParB/RepB/Spo0J family partition protein [Crossiella equi]MBP2477651.1 ParB family chromosome partitioning protein [Crossiella equi]
MTAELSITIVDLDVQALAEHPVNREVQHDKVAWLKASIKEVGLLQPLVVIPLADGGYRIVSGAHRVHAVAALGWDTVPCIIRADLNEARALLALLVDNDSHTHLTVAERARIDSELALFPEYGTPSKLSKACGRGIKEIKGSLAVHKLGAKAAAAVQANQMTLDDAAELAAFEKRNPELAAKILNNNSGPNIRFALAGAKRKMEKDRMLQTARRELTTEGVTIYPAEPGFPDYSRMAPLEYLQTADGQPLNEEEVRTQPGYGAVLDFTYPSASVRITYVCLKPEEQGLKRICGRYANEEKRQAAAEEHARLEKHYEELAAANEVRANWLVGQLSTQAQAKAWFDDVLRILAECSIGEYDRELADRMCAKPTNGLDNSVGAARHRIVVMMLCVLHKVAEGDPVPGLAVVASRFQAMLSARGYTPSDIERAHNQEWEALLPPKQEQADEQNQDKSA